MCIVSLELYGKVCAVDSSVAQNWCGERCAVFKERYFMTMMLRDMVMMVMIARTGNNVCLREQVRLGLEDGSLAEAQVPLRPLTEGVGAADSMQGGHRPHDHHHQPHGGALGQRPLAGIA